LREPIIKEGTIPFNLKGGDVEEVEAVVKPAKMIPVCMRKQIVFKSPGFRVRLMLPAEHLQMLFHLESTRDGKVE